MKFTQIDSEALEPNQKYKIKWKGNEYTAIFYQHSEHGCLDFVKVNQDTFPFLRLHSFFNLIVYQPIFQKEQIQTTMEIRAVNMILRKILGDPYFEWCT